MTSLVRSQARFPSLIVQEFGEVDGEEEGKKEDISGKSDQRDFYENGLWSLPCSKGLGHHLSHCGMETVYWSLVRTTPILGSASDPVIAI